MATMNILEDTDPDADLTNLDASWLINEKAEQAKIFCEHIQTERVNHGKPTVKLLVSEPYATGDHDVRWWKKHGFVGIYYVRAKTSQKSQQEREDGNSHGY